MIRIRMFVVVVVMGLNAIAVPFGFDDSSDDVKDFVVIGITNSMKSATVALMQGRIDESLRPETLPMSWGVEYELGFQRSHCLLMLKGDLSLSGNRVCYLYATPRRASVLPRLYTSMGGGVTGGPKLECYFVGNKISSDNMVRLEGRGKWMYHPPYDPYTFYDDELVQLMLLTPEHKLDKTRINIKNYSDGIIPAVGDNAENCMLAKSEELVAKLGLKAVFSNRVFRMNEGCAFQVDYQLPEKALDEKGMAVQLKKMKEINSDKLVLMHLSAEEVSEVVYLAFLVDGGDVKGYEAACARCPKVLKPVGEFKTGIGKRLHKAMQEGGMLPISKK